MHLSVDGGLFVNVLKRCEKTGVMYMEGQNSVFRFVQLGIAFVYLHSRSQITVSSHVKAGNERVARHKLHYLNYSKTRGKRQPFYHSCGPCGLTECCLLPEFLSKQWCSILGLRDGFLE